MTFHITDGRVSGLPAALFLCVAGRKVVVCVAWEGEVGRRNLRGCGVVPINFSVYLISVNNSGSLNRLFSMFAKWFK